jgi:hypothetical protein
VNVAQRYHEGICSLWPHRELKAWPSGVTVQFNGDTHPVETPACVLVARSAQVLYDASEDECVVPQGFRFRGSVFRGTNFVSPAPSLPRKLPFHKCYPSRVYLAMKGQGERMGELSSTAFAQIDRS